MKNNTVMTEAICEQTTLFRTKGKSIRFIADRLGVSTGSIAHFCLKEGVESPRNENKVLPQQAPGPTVFFRNGRKVRHFTPDEDRRLLDMDISGMRVCEIAKALDRQPNSIRGRMMTLARQEERSAFSAFVDTDRRGLLDKGHGS